MDLIRNAEVWGVGLADVVIADGIIAAIHRHPGPDPGPLPANPDTPASSIGSSPGRREIDARGAALLPGLHDHHIHLAGLAARSASILCGPPEVKTAAELAARLTAHPGAGWIRGIGYHDSVMGLPDAAALDDLVADRPLRIQHRSGRMWLFNSRALDELLGKTAPPAGLERQNGRFTGRLFDDDLWLREALGSVPPDFSAISAKLARCGVTGITDMSPRNDAAIAGHFSAQQSLGHLQQRSWLAGELGLADAIPAAWQLGPAKLHLHEAALPTFDETLELITASHAQGRAVAVHCVTEVELVYTLAAFEAAGTVRGDRIEHASVAALNLVDRIAGLGLAVCVQPHFVYERGDAYLRDVEPRHHADLYRLASLAKAGIALAGGSDAPFASEDPWDAMRAAVSRETREGKSITEGEALSPETALALYLAAPDDLSRLRRIAVGEPADLCLLHGPWAEVRSILSSTLVRTTFIAGEVIHNGVDQAPF